MEVLSSDDDSVGHLSRVDDTVKDSASDRDVASEGALLVDVGAVDGLWQSLLAFYSNILKHHLVIVDGSSRAPHLQPKR